MEILWSPWRAKYIASGSDNSQADTCVFCNISRDPANDEKNFVVYRALHNFVVLNLYPYISGHLLIVPYEHVAELVGHLHVHILPRWSGDTNFMSTVAQTRIISEDLNTTYEKLRDKF